jgi:hypothetical protein
MSLSLFSNGYYQQKTVTTRAVPVSSQNFNESLIIAKPYIPGQFESKEIRGIFQSDIIVRGAMIEAISDLRARPYLLDSVFASLPKDCLTSEKYGVKTVSEAKKWFLKNGISIDMAPLQDQPNLPAIVISLSESNVGEQSLGHIHYTPSEKVLGPPKAISESFNATYDFLTGEVTPITKFSFKIFKDNLISDSVGNLFEIKEVASDSFFIEPRLVAEFKNSYILTKTPNAIVNIESVIYNENYQIGIHCHSEPFHALVLENIIFFILLRYKKELFEKRGIDSLSINRSAFNKNEKLSDTELVYSRYLSLKCKVRHSWPQEEIELPQALDGFQGERGRGAIFAAIGSGDMVVEPDQQNPESHIWTGQENLPIKF